MGNRAGLGWGVNRSATLAPASDDEVCSAKPISVARRACTMSQAVRSSSGNNANCFKFDSVSLSWAIPDGPK